MWQAIAEKVFTREVGFYLIFGISTTIVNMVTFQVLEHICRKKMGIKSYWVSNPIAFVAALVFAFITNKLFVFESTSWALSVVLREAGSFTAMRLLSFGMEQGLMVLFFEKLWPKVSGWWIRLLEKMRIKSEPERLYRFITKLCFIQFLVVVLNYIFSKFFIFR
ncbi:MAG: GtrA family protein [Oscillospiraceae bacterium]|jgi:putative flippase GtrA|nr:GtrA family protein [Oscillospiraceae bacterium]